MNNASNAGDSKLIDHYGRLNGIVTYCEEAYMTQNKEGVIALTKDYTYGGLVKISEGILLSMGEVDNSISSLIDNLNKLQVNLDGIHHVSYLCLI